jgi:hypothetical protein
MMTVSIDVPPNPSSTVTSNVRIWAGSPIFIAGAVKVGCAVFALERVAVSPDS